MNSEEMSEVMQKINNMINSSSDNNSTNTNSSQNSVNFDNFQNLLSNINFNSSDDSSNSNTDFDFDTIFKIKGLIDKFNSLKSSSDVKLLNSLRPYLNNSRKQKLDQYIQFMNFAKIIENLNFDGEVHKNEL